LSGAFHYIVTSVFETVVVEGADGTFGILDALMSTDDDEAPSPTAFLTIICYSLKSLQFLLQGTRTREYKLLIIIGN
jgi:hypothetical protein